MISQNDFLQILCGSDYSDFVYDNEKASKESLMPCVFSEC